MVIDIHAVPDGTRLLFFTISHCGVFFLRNVDSVAPTERGERLCGSGAGVDRGPEPHSLCKIFCVTLARSVIPSTVTNHMRNKAYVPNTMSHLDVTKTEDAEEPKMRRINLIVSLDP